MTDKNLLTEQVAHLQTKRALIQAQQQVLQMLDQQCLRELADRQAALSVAEAAEAAGSATT